MRRKSLPKDWALEMRDVFIDKETLSRYLRSFKRITDLRYWSSPPPHALIVPSDKIDRFEEFAFADTEWRVFTTDWLSSIPADQMYLAIDFYKLHRTDRAMLFAFLKPDHNDWLKFLLQVKRLGIVNGQNGSVSTGLSINLDSLDFAEVVADWLATTK